MNSAITQQPMLRLATCSRGVRQLNKVQWAAQVAFDSFGFVYGVRANSDGGLSSLDGFLPPIRREHREPVVDCLYSVIVPSGAAAGTGEEPMLVYRDGRCIVRTADTEFGLLRFESDLVLQLASRAPNRVFVHAGVVAWEGKAIVIPGRSMAGKSTLVNALVLAGATYLSDEFAVFDSNGLVYPYPRPIGLRAGRRRKTLIVPARIRTSRPLPVGLIAVLKYRAGARWEPRNLSRGNAVLELLRQTAIARMRPEMALSWLSQATRDCDAILGVRDEADKTAERLLDIVRRRQPSHS